MPLSGEYAPSPLDWLREQADTYMKSGVTEGNTAAGKAGHPATVGATGKLLRKTPADARRARRPVRRDRRPSLGSAEKGLVPTS